MFFKKTYNTVQYIRSYKIDLSCFRSKKLAAYLSLCQPSSQSLRISRIALSLYSSPSYRRRRRRRETRLRKSLKKRKSPNLYSLLLRLRRYEGEEEENRDSPSLRQRRRRETRRKRRYSVHSLRRTANGERAEFAFASPKAKKRRVAPSLSARRRRRREEKRRAAFASLMLLSATKAQALLFAFGEAPNLCAFGAEKCKLYLSRTQAKTLKLLSKDDFLRTFLKFFACVRRRRRSEAKAKERREFAFGEALVSIIV
jgi:hypothetical protein